MADFTVTQIDEKQSGEWSIMGWVNGKCVIDIVLYSDENLSAAIDFAKEEWELAQ